MSDMQDDGELELTQEMMLDTEQDDPDQEPQDGEPQSDEIVIDLDEPEAADEGSAVLRALREENRKKARRIAELEAAQRPATVEVGEKPKLSDFDYDEEQFDAAYSAWIARKSQADEQQRRQEEAQRETQETWNRIETGYRAKVAELAVPNFEQKEAIVAEELPELLVKAIKAYSSDPAKVIAAIGTNANLRDQIASEKDPIKALVSIIRMEDKMTLRRKTQAEPDRPLKGTAPVSTESSDKVLARLEKEAEKTGDRTKVIEYRRAQRARSAA